MVICRSVKQPKVWVGSETVGGNAKAPFSCVGLSTSLGQPSIPFTPCVSVGCAGSLLAIMILDVSGVMLSHFSRSCHRLRVGTGLADSLWHFRSAPAGC